MPNKKHSSLLKLVCPRCWPTRAFPQSRPS